MDFPSLLQHSPPTRTLLLALLKSVEPTPVSKVFCFIVLVLSTSTLCISSNFHFQERDHIFLYLHTIVYKYINVFKEYFNVLLCFKIPLYALASGIAVPALVFLRQVRAEVGVKSSFSRSAV